MAPTRPGLTLPRAVIEGAALDPAAAFQDQHATVQQAFTELVVALA